jgi:hypothetical protein
MQLLYVQLVFVFSSLKIQSAAGSIF